MRLLHLLALGLLLTSVGLRADESLKNPIPDVISKAAFCIAYTFRDADERDIRPVPPDNDPFRPESGEEIQQGGILNSDSPVDVAALASRVIAQGRLSKKHLSVVYKAVLDGDSVFPVAECYDPHHAIVFYSHEGNPLCCIEICFQCSRVRISPEFRTSKPQHWEQSDLIALAGIFDELKLPLSRFKNLEELKKSLESSRAKLELELK